MSNYHNHQNRHIKFGNLDLRLDSEDPTVQVYSERFWHEEFQSYFFDDVRENLNPDIILDIGANYGVTSVFMKNKIPKAELICFEPNPELITYIHFNLKNNKIDNYKVNKSIVGATKLNKASFHINPSGSQDSRVIPIDITWPVVFVNQTTITEIMKNHLGKKVFMKIDCQGYEKEILDGAYDFLLTNNDWLIKMEFDPSRLKSQSSDPSIFLSHLIKNFDIVEFPARYTFKTNYKNLFDGNVIEANSSDKFLNYIIKLDRNDKGWVDLLIRPRVTKI